MEIYDKGETQEIIVDPDIGEKLLGNFTCRARVDELIMDSLEIMWFHDGVSKAATYFLYLSNIT